jgi:hypothetical protein
LRATATTFRKENGGRSEIANQLDGWAFDLEQYMAQVCALPSRFQIGDSVRTVTHGLGTVTGVTFGLVDGVAKVMYDVNTSKGPAYRVLSDDIAPPASPSHLRVVKPDGALASSESQYRFTGQDCDLLMDHACRLAPSTGVNFIAEVGNYGHDIALAIAAEIRRNDEVELWRSLYVWTFDCSTQELSDAARAQFDQFGDRGEFLAWLASDCVPKLLEKWRRATAEAT